MFAIKLILVVVHGNQTGIKKSYVVHNLFLIGYFWVMVVVS